MDLITILLSMGLPTIDENLDKLLVEMNNLPSFLGSTLGLAKVVGSAIAVGVGSYECWMMMLGRRGMDVMKILRILIISICISSSGIICGGIKGMVRPLELQAKVAASNQNAMVAAQEMKLAELQSSYLDKLRAYQDTVAKAEKAQEIGDDPDFWDEAIYTIKNLGTTIDQWMQRATVLTEQKICEWINTVIRFLGELIFQMTYYGMYVVQKAAMACLEVFCPLIFALSLAPPWKSAWSQWMSKYITIGLWGWVINVFMCYIDHMILFYLGQDITAYEALLNQASSGGWEEVGAIGLMGIGTTCMYAVSMVIGAFILKFVPEVASWLIPGGVSSGMGHGIGSGVMSGSSTVGGKVVNTTRTVAGAIGTQAGKNLQHNF